MTTAPDQGTITRTAGSWSDEGFAIDQTIEITGTVVGGATATQSFRVIGVTGEGLEIEGAALALAGIVLAMPLVPGQGILTILIGLSLLDFPGKRKMELKLIRLRAVRRGINWIRARAQQPPLELPPREKKKKK